MNLSYNLMALEMKIKFNIKNKWKNKTNQFDRLNTRDDGKEKNKNTCKDSYLRK